MRLQQSRHPIRQRNHVEYPLANLLHEQGHFQVLHDARMIPLRDEGLYHLLQSLEHDGQTGLEGALRALSGIIVLDIVRMGRAIIIDGNLGRHRVPVVSSLFALAFTLLAV